MWTLTSNSAPNCLIMKSQITKRIPFGSTWIHPSFWLGLCCSSFYLPALCYVFVLCLSLSCVLCCEFLWIIRSYLAIRFSLTFIMHRQIECNNTAEIIVEINIKSWLNSEQFCKTKTEEGVYIWHSTHIFTSDIVHIYSYIITSRDCIRSFLKCLGGNLFFYRKCWSI